MKNLYYLIILILIVTTANAQSLEDTFSIKKMKKDLQVFKNIRIKANSGLYKYRTKKQIDSIYKWADREIERSKTYRDFYNIVSQLTDFEGSCHNGCWTSDKVYKNMKTEKSGYFPYPIKLIEDKIRLNINDKKIPLGAEILTINNEQSTKILSNLYKYYYTDGFNLTGKAIGINSKFATYYRMHYGLQNNFKITYKINGSKKIKEIVIKSISYSKNSNNHNKRHSKTYDNMVGKDWDENKKYIYKKINKKTGLLIINSFDIGDNEESDEHKKFAVFLERIFKEIKITKIQNLIIDIRHNNGGSDPNELIPYTYLTTRNFSENYSAWISFNKVPYLKYIESKVPKLLRPLGVIPYNKNIKKQFPVEKNGKFYEDGTSYNHIIRKPNKNAFLGKIYLLISPEVASAGSNFGSLVASNSNTTVIGEETSGGFFGHNGHFSISYILPKSKIKIFFSLVNLEQSVLKKENQLFGRGIIPDYKVEQTYADFLTHTDTQMNFVLELITKK